MAIGEMTFNEYQELAAGTAIYPKRGEIAGLTYTVLGLNGEAGEVAEKIKKALRDDDGVISEAKTYELAKELGDVLWYVAETASQLNLSLGQIAEINVEKETRKSAENDEFFGKSFITPVTLYIALSISTLSPTGFDSLNSIFEYFSVRTTVFGSLKTVAGFPETIGNGKIPKNASLANSQSSRKPVLDCSSSGVVIFPL